MKKVLLVYYSQTGQLAGLAHRFAEPLRQSGAVRLDCVGLRPQKPYPFPWPFWRFFDTFPETVHFRPEALEEPEIPDGDYDVVVIAYTVWFLSPARPVSAFLQRAETRRLLHGKPVITLVGCRNMWLAAQEKMKTLLAQNGARLIGNIVKTDACGRAASFITTPAWLLTGDRQYFRSLPAAGIAPEEIADGARFGAKLRDVLAAGQPLDETLFRSMGAAKVDEKLIFSEQAAARSFYLWGRLLMAAGRVSPLLRRILLAVYIVFLIGMILTVVPVSAAVKRLLRPWLRGWLEKQKRYYGQPSGE
ncbi:dialkylresorcinol condensing enzyme [Neisseria leonii]|uniref:Dialkylresorcinol condensing enzyme n=1 Tax=Neisseria leonii TaxID=2995413 RepID=A0A9X4E973_9NEIS|nr:dialkylrecorsinol condensing enzyme [Neisseria sp. 51.81]MDD9327848.1 dialkylresorcinol condensing enzyme [Neisseria sp. 51.81]